MHRGRDILICIHSVITYYTLYKTTHKRLYCKIVSVAEVSDLLLYHVCFEISAKVFALRDTIPGLSSQLDLADMTKITASKPQVAHKVCGRKV